MRRVFMSVLACPLLMAAARAPDIRPEAGPLGQLVVHVAIKTDDGGLRPVAGAGFALTCEGPDAFPTNVCTGADGRGSAYARPGKCRLKSLSPVRIGGKRYTWEGALEIVLAKESRLELSGDNAVVLDTPDAASEPPATDVATDDCGEAAIVPDEHVVLPVLVFKTEPEYPPEAKRNRIDGKVICEAVVGTDGHVRHIKVVKTSDPIFNASARLAAATRRYIPARLNGRPVAVTFTIRMDYRAR